MNPIRTIIADDESLAREYLRKLFASCEHVELVSECRNGIEAVNAIIQYQPDLVFLDIQMPDLNGFEVIREIRKETKLPFIIFATAYEQFALKAFEVSAVDYLLKPFTEHRFNEALRKAIDLLGKNKLAETNAAIEALLRLYNRERETKPVEIYPSRMLIKANKKLLFVNTSDIRRLEASGDYVKVFAREQVYLVNDSLSNLEQTLDPTVFVRVHRSHIVNVQGIVEFRPYFNGEYILLMNNGHEVKLSRSYKDKVRLLLGKDFT